MSEPFTSEQMRAVAAEINAWTCMAYPEEVAAGEWRITIIEHLRSLQDEVYRVTYPDGYQHLFQRDTYDGKLHPVATWSYEARHNFEDMHKSARKASAPDVEVV